MNGKFKALTMAVVVMFCLTAVICVVSDADTSADDTVEHFLYFALILCSWKQIDNIVGVRHDKSANIVAIT